jgi:2',3'-cyclic-nucleotide 2'-phosphodiesterase/3'-nucleotidase
MMITGGHVEMGDIKPDQEYIKLFSGYIDTVQRFVDQPVGILTRSISTEESFFGPSAFTDLIHRVQLEITGADLSFAAPLSFRANLPAGELTVKDLFRLYRYENQLYTMKLTGEEILRYLNYSYSLWMNRMTGPNDAMINMAQEPGGSWRLSRPSYNFDSAAGIDYTVDVSQPPGRMVAILQMSDGKPYELDRFYTVAVNSYRGSGGGGHLGEAGLTTEIRNERLASSTGKDFRLILADWIRKQKTVEPAAGTNWKVIPEDWIRIAAPRDKARLFGN